jgi:hypothetical protein
LGWKQSTCSVNIPAFSGIEGLNPNSTITEDSFPLDFFRLFFENEILTIIQNESNRYAEQQITKKKQEGSLKTKSLHAQWKEIKLFFRCYNIHVSGKRAIFT